MQKWVTEKPIVKKMIEAGYPTSFSSSQMRKLEKWPTASARRRESTAVCLPAPNVAVALKIAKRLPPGSNVVTLIVDRRDRYLSEYPNDKYVV